MKKMLFVFVGIMLISTMVFANSGKDTTPADPFYPINISVFHETGTHPQPNKNNPIYAWLERELKVTFTWDILVGEIGQRRATMIAGKNYPDVLELRGAEWIEAGALIPLEGLIEQYGPNIKKHYASVWDGMKSADGHIYYLVNYGVIQGVDHNPNYNGVAFWIQKDILARAGYPKVTSLDQYFQLIENYYRANPTINGQPTIPFTILMHDWRAFELWNPPNFLAGNPNDGNGVVSGAPNYVYKSFFTMDISKRWFQYLNGINQRGLLDRSFATDTYDQYTAKISSGRVLGQSVQGWQFESADRANRDRGQNQRTQAPLAITFDTSIKPWYRNATIPNYLRGMGISVSAKDPVRIIRFINQLLEPANQRTMTWGIEGLHWQMGTDGVPYRTPDQRDNWNNQNWQELNRGLLMGDIFPKVEGSYADGIYAGLPSDLGFLLSERSATMLPEDLALYQAYGVNGSNSLMDPNPPANNVWFPTWNMEGATPPSGSPAAIALTRCEETMKRLLPAIILAAPAQFETLWNQYVAAMNEAGVATYDAYMQGELDKRLNGMGIRTPAR